MKQKPVEEMALCAFFAALTAVLSQISIPLQPVPVNLATLSVCLAGGVLGAGPAAVSQGIYVLLGMIGLPVFAGMSGGAGVVAGPTGGYIVGYVAEAWLIGFLRGKTGGGCVPTALAMASGSVLLYSLGTAWFMVSTKTGLIASLWLCVLPFLIGDALKIAAAAAAVPRLSRALRRIRAGRAG
jgi:biotin transport system substrate-specific component